MEKKNRYHDRAKYPRKACTSLPEPGIFDARREEGTQLRSDGREARIPSPRWRTHARASRRARGALYSSELRIEFSSEFGLQLKRLGIGRAAEP